MAATYKSNSTNTTIVMGNNYSYHVPNAFQDTYAVTRGFLRFNGALITAALGDITSIKLKLKFTQIAFNPTNVYLRSATGTDDNWGTALTAALADYISTIAHLEDTVYIDATGWYEFDIDKNNLDFAGWNWFRLNTQYDYSQTNTVPAIASQNAVSAGDRPYIEVTYSSGAVRDIIGVGIIPFVR